MLARTGVADQVCYLCSANREPLWHRISKFGGACKYTLYILDPLVIENKLVAVEQSPPDIFQGGGEVAFVEGE